MADDYTSPSQPIRYADLWSEELKTEQYPLILMPTAGENNRVSCSLWSHWTSSSISTDL